MGGAVFSASLFFCGGFFSGWGFFGGFFRARVRVCVRAGVCVRVCACVGVGVGVRACVRVHLVDGQPVPTFGPFTSINRRIS